MPYSQSENSAVARFPIFFAAHFSMNAVGMKSKPNLIQANRRQKRLPSLLRSIYAGDLIPASPASSKRAEIASKHTFDLLQIRSEQPGQSSPDLFI